MTKSIPSRAFRLLFARSAPILCLLVAACSSSGSPAAGGAGGGGAGAAGGAGGSGGIPDGGRGDAARDVGDAAPGVCGATDAGPGGDDACTGDRAPGAVCVKSVSGQVVDGAGKPLPCILVSVCGTICFFAETTPDGSFTARVNQFLKPEDYAVLAHGRPDRASVYVALPKQGSPSPSADRIALPSPIKLVSVPPSGPPLPSDPAAPSKATSGDVTLEAPAGNKFQLDPEDLELKEKGGQLRVAKVAREDFPPFAIEAKLAVVYAISPFEAKSKEKLKVTIAGSAGFEPGTAVELVVLGNELLLPPITAGRALVAATGKVSADGKTIETDPGEGITTLTWLGVRKKGG